MAEEIHGPESTCLYCEKSVSGRNTNERACMDVSPLRMTFLGPRFVKYNHTCPKFVLDKKYGGRGR